MEDDKDYEEDDNDIIQVLEPNDLNIQKTQSLNEKLRKVQVEAEVNIEKPKRESKALNATLCCGGAMQQQTRNQYQCYYILIELLLDHGVPGRGNKRKK